MLVYSTALNFEHIIKYCQNISENIVTPHSIHSQKVQLFKATEPLSVGYLTAKQSSEV